MLIHSENKFVSRALLSIIIVIMFVVLILIIGVLNSFKDAGEFYVRLLGVFAIIDFLGTIVKPILNKVYAIKS